jgi:hypothetical protein
MNHWIRSRLLAVLVLPMAIGSGCAGMGVGTMDDILLGGGLPGRGSDVTGEVHSVDTRRQRITVQTGRHREQVFYDSRTQVVSGQRRFPVSALGRGDYVSMRVERDRRGNLHATRINVRQTVADRGGTVGRGGARVQRFDGEVRQIDRRQGRFVVRSRQGNVTVTLPYNPARGTEDRFRRLRNGDRVRIEGQIVDRNRVELRRFL